MFSSILVSFIALAIGVHAGLVKRVSCPGTTQTTSNPACCKFISLRDDLQKTVFQGECGEDVHEILRLAFHDAIGFSKTGALKGTGADGSMIIFDSIETAFHANAGIDDSVDTLSPFLTSHPHITAGDLIQFAAAVGITNCAGAPRLQFLAGRPNATIPASDNTVPDPDQSVDVILARIVDAGLVPADMVNLLVSHTIARSDHIDPNLQHVPFDTTPFTFDTQFFLETLLKGTGFPGGSNNTGEVSSATANEGSMRLQSDFEFAHDSRTACQWQSFINNQQLMMGSFKSSMAKMAVIGQNTAKLCDCSDVIPIPKAPVSKPATYPATKSKADIQQSCPSPFPVLKTDPGRPTPIPACPDGTFNATAC